MEVRDAFEEGRPVLLHLLPAAEASAWMRRLLAPVVEIDALEECVQVVPVHRKVEALEDVGRLGARFWVHSPIMAALEPCPKRGARLT